MTLEGNDPKAGTIEIRTQRITRVVWKLKKRSGAGAGRSSTEAVLPKPKLTTRNPDDEQRAVTLLQDLGATATRTNGRVAYLHLKGPRFTDDVLVNLEALPKLRELSIARARITDDGLLHLEGLTELKELEIKGTKVTRQGVGKLRRALPKLGSVDFTIPTGAAVKNREIGSASLRPVPAPPPDGVHLPGSRRADSPGAAEGGAK